jgi:membrane peptidoglycan carboxypeptidase
VGNPWLRAVHAFACLIAFVLVAALAGVIGSAVFIPAASVANKVSGSTSEFVDGLPTELNDFVLPQKSIMLAGDGTPIAQFYEENRIPVAITAVNPLMAKAVVAIEDSRFYEHRGVDTRGVIRAAVHNASDDGGQQGASTLTMQYVRNLLIEQAVARGDKQGIKDARKRENSRKIKEMRLAVELEKRTTKEKILEGYLNIADFNDRVYGVEAASRHYFGRSARQLSLSQAATLAGMVQSPKRLNPRVFPAASQARRNVVLGRMLQLGVIGPDDYRKAATQPLVKDLKIVPTPSGCANAGLLAYFCDYVIAQLELDPGFAALGKNSTARRTAIMTGGLTIRTSINLGLQRAAWAAADTRLPHADKSKVATAAVTVQPGSGKVLAMVQNRIYRIDAKGAGTTSINFAVDKRYGGSNGFQTGSTFKPFTLATWLAAGKRTNDQVSADKKSWMPHDFKACGKPLRGTKPFPVNNSESDEGGLMTVTEATAKSVNAAYMAMESALDLCAVAGTAEKLGVHTAIPTDDCGTGTKSTKLPRCIPTLTLGVKEVAPVTMAAAYAAFANRGVYCEPQSIVAVQARGKPVPVPGRRCRQALPAPVAAGVAYVMQHTMRPGGTAAASNLGKRPSAGKTGTTNDDVDTWFAGYTPQLATAVWVGDPTLYNGKRRNLKNRRIAGKFYPNIYGSKMAAPIWKDIMLAAHRGLPVIGFPGPPPAMVGPPPTAKPPECKPEDQPPGKPCPTKPATTPSPTPTPTPGQPGRPDGRG